MTFQICRTVVGVSYDVSLEVRLKVPILEHRMAGQMSQSETQLPTWWLWKSVGVRTLTPELLTASLAERSETTCFPLGKRKRKNISKGFERKQTSLEYFINRIAITRVFH